MKKLLILLMMAILATSAALAQCPGPAQRTNLINLQKSQSVEGTLAGQIPLTDNCGNQRYAQYTEAENTPIGFIPTATGNVSNFSEFVIASDSTRWYIDWQGRGYLMGSGSTVDRNGYYGGNFGNGGDNTIPSVTRSTLTNQLTFYRATDNLGGLVPVRIQVDAGNEPDFMSFRNLTDSFTIKRSDQDFELRCSNGISMFGNTTGTPGNGGVSIFANEADIILDADENIEQSSLNGYISLTTSTLGIDLTAEENVHINSNTSAPLIIQSGDARQAEYFANYCDPTILRGIPDNECVQGMISDSLPDGLIHQTLRYSATNVLQANSQIYNNGNQVAIGTTTFPSWAELHVLGDTRLDDQVFVGNAVGRTNTSATIGVNDTAKASFVYFTNRWNNASGNMDQYIRVNHASAEPRLHWYNAGFGEVLYNAGVGSGNQFYFTTDGSGTMGASRVYTITPPIGGSLTGNIGVQIDAPTARLHLAGAVDGEINSASLKFELGDELDTPEDGAVYFAPASGTTDDLYLNADGISYHLAKTLKASAVIDFASIEPGEWEVSGVIAVTGAAIGDQVVLGFGDPLVLQGLSFQGYVAAADVVRIVATNIRDPALGPIDPDSATYTVRLFK